MIKTIPAYLITAICVFLLACESSVEGEEIISENTMQVEELEPYSEGLAYERPSGQANPIIGYKEVLSLDEIEKIIGIDVDEGLSKLSSLTTTSGAYFEKGTGHSIAISISQRGAKLDYDARKKYFDIKASIGENKIRELAGIGDDAFIIPGLNSQTVYVLYDEYYILMLLYNELFNGDNTLLANLSRVAVNNLQRAISQPISQKRVGIRSSTF